MEGGGGMVATELDGSISETATTITVDSTVGFLSGNSSVTIGEEEMFYTTSTPVTFANVSRGYNQTTAETHSTNSRVYGADAAVLNRALGFNVLSTEETAGDFAVITLTWNFLAKAVPKLITWNFSFLTGQLVFLRLVFQAVGAGLVIYYGFNAISSAFGILRG